MHKERSLLVGLHELDGLIREDIAAVCSLRVLIAERLHRAARKWRKVSAAARAARGISTYIDIKPLRLRVFTEMPFAQMDGLVATCLERFGHRKIVVRKMAFVRYRDNFTIGALTSFGRANGIHSVPGAILTADTARPARSTVSGRRIGIGKNHPLRRQPIQVRRAVFFPSHEPNIHDSKVIRVDIDNIRPLCGHCTGTHQRHRNQNQQSVSQTFYIHIFHHYYLFGKRGMTNFQPNHAMMLRSRPHISTVIPPAKMVVEAV